MPLINRVLLREEGACLDEDGVGTDVLGHKVGNCCPFT